jgi:cytochrome P450
MSCPVSETFDPFSSDYLTDPHPVLRATRGDGRVFFSSRLQRYVVTRFSDVEQILMNPSDFSSAITVKPLCPLSADAQAVLAKAFPRLPTLSNADGERHSEMRKHVQAVLSLRRLRTLRGVVEQRAAEMIEQMLTKPTADWYAELAFPLPAITAFELLGFPTEDTNRIKDWVTNRQIMTWGNPTAEQQLEIAGNILAFSDYIEDVIEQRKVSPRDDAISELLEIHRTEPESLSLVDIANIVFLLSAGAHETTTALLVHAVRRLLEHPQQWQDICRDASLIPNAVEEALRYDASQFAWSRITTKPVTVGGVDLPAGAELLIVLGEANRDDEEFSDADTFDLRRERARRHLSFGKGIHFCLGAPLARMQGEVVLRLLTAAAPEVALLSGQSFPYEPNAATRSPKELWLDLSACRREGAVA